MQPSLSAFDDALRELLSDLGAEIRARLRARSGLDALRAREDGDTTHAFDAYAEEHILRLFQSTRLPVRFSSEESEDVDLVADPSLLAVVDPLDGSAFLTRGHAVGSISVSVVDLESARPVLSRVLDVFADVQYSAAEGRVTRNGASVRPSEVATLDRALVVTYASTSDRMAFLCRQLARWPRVGHVINHGGPLGMVKVGSGECDVAFEASKGFMPRDYVAGAHIAQTAGAVVTQLDGSSLPFAANRVARVRFVAAANPALHATVLELLSGET
jgi:fructose-1,6-bisphosphatase/inositol monophosphatase family enzyme